MTIQHDEITRMAADEPTFTGAPDLTTIRRAGRRMRSRRRIATGVATLAVVGAIGVPVGLAAGGGPESSPPVGPAGGTHHTRDDVPTDVAEPPFPEGCMSLGCVDDSTPETGEVVGEPMVIGGLSTGQDVVVYAVRPEPGTGVRVATGFVGARGDVRRLELVLDPGHEGPGRVHLAGGELQSRGGKAWYTVVGLVDYETGTIARQSDADGLWRNVNHSTDVLPGHTVFTLSGTWHDSWDPAAPAPVDVRVSGRTYTR